MSDVSDSAMCRIGVVNIHVGLIAHRKALMNNRLLREVQSRGRRPWAGAGRHASIGNGVEDRLALGDAQLKEHCRVCAREGNPRRCRART